MKPLSSPESIIISMALLGAISLFLYIYKLLIVEPKLLRSQLHNQGIRGPPPSLLHGNTHQIQKIKANSNTTTNHQSQHISHDYFSKIFPYFQLWKDEYGNSSENALKWPERLSVLIGIAKAVHFFHTGITPGFGNNRLRTNSILLDEHGIAKLSDYGLSVITEEMNKLEVKGERKKLRKKPKLEDDVYSFGLILYKTLVGSPSLEKGEAYRPNNMALLGSRDGQREMVEPIVLTTSCEESLSVVISIMNKCMIPEASIRPSFEDVLWNLQYAAQVQATSDGDQKLDIS